MISFEWDKNKAEINYNKHGVSFEEAQSVFYDENAKEFFTILILKKKIDSLCLDLVTKFDF
ncbi:BrnT family toxin [Thiospirochaeta perfilievii]|uniref:BrnT family toxin n=1 Tax=Thiospirochaeta perfilievii TaxID=252967 RepID=UPI00319E6BB2